MMSPLPPFEVALQLVDDRTARIAVEERAGEIERVGIVEKADLARLGRQRAGVGLLLIEIAADLRASPGRLGELAVDDDRLVDPQRLDGFCRANGGDVGLRVRARRG